MLIHKFCVKLGRITIVYLDFIPCHSFSWCYRFNKTATHEQPCWLVCETYGLHRSYGGNVICCCCTMDNLGEAATVDCFSFGSISFSAVLWKFYLLSDKIRLLCLKFGLYREYKTMLIAVYHNSSPFLISPGFYNKIIESEFYCGKKCRLCHFLSQHNKWLQNTMDTANH